MYDSGPSSMQLPRLTCLIVTDTCIPQLTALGLYHVARNKLLLISRPTEGKRLSCSELGVGYHFAPGWSREAIVILVIVVSPTVLACHDLIPAYQ